MLFPHLCRIVRAILPHKTSTHLAIWWRLRRNRRHHPRQIERQYRGHLLKLRIADETAQAWYDHDFESVHVAPELDILCLRKLKPGSTVFDIGAHQAVVALIMAREVGDAGQVIAVEADPWNAHGAEINKSLNEAHNLKVILGAATSSLGNEGEGGEQMFEWNLSGVPRVTVDQLARDFGRPDVVYIDVDGFECQVLRGSAETLQTHADWFVEVHVKAGLEAQGGSWQEVMSFFGADGYKCLISSENSPEFIPFDASSAILSERFFLLALHRSNSGFMIERA